MQFWISFLCFLFVFSGTSHLCGQSRQDIANLIQDVELITQEVARLRFEVKTLQREKKTLETALVATDTRITTFETQLAGLNTQTQKNLQALRTQLVLASEKQKSQIIANVTEQLAQIVVEMERAFKELQGNVAPNDKTASPNEKKTFGNNFPKTGLEYTVKKGDNLWKIAQEFSSKTSWIQDANRLTSPSQLQVGQVLFIPQKQ